MIFARQPGGFFRCQVQRHWHGGWLARSGAQEMYQDGSHGLQVREVPGGGKMPPVPQDSAMDQVFFALDEISLESFIKC